MADLGLANTMDTAKALLQSVGVPGQVVVDHEAGILQVNAFTCGISGNQYQHFRIVAELLLRLTTIVPISTPVNGEHGNRVA